MSESVERDVNQSPDGTGETSNSASLLVEDRCQYPGCTRRAAAPVPGAGRRPRYCGEVVGGTEHNRQNARNARLALRAAGVPLSATDPGSAEPVTIARAQASELTRRIEEALIGHTQLLGQTLDQLRVLGDPRAVEAQLSTVTTAARAEAEQAHAVAAAAEQARLAAEARAIAAEADRDEADELVSEAEVARVAVQTEADAAKAALQLAADTVSQLRVEAERLAGTVTATTARAEAAEHQLALEVTRADTAEQEADGLRADLDELRTRALVDREVAVEAARAANGQIEALSRRLETAEHDGDAARGQFDELRQRLTEQQAAAAVNAATAAAQLAAARDLADRLTGELVAARGHAAELGEAVAAGAAELAASLAALETEREHAATWRLDLTAARDRLQAEVAQLRADLDAARSARGPHETR